MNVLETCGAAGELVEGWIDAGQTEAVALPSEDEVHAYLDELVADPCVDNYRIGYLDDMVTLMEYGVARDCGCCARRDVLVYIAGRLAVVGCNYGH